jgi:hypothetical protein
MNRLQRYIDSEGFVGTVFQTVFPFPLGGTSAVFLSNVRCVCVCVCVWFVYTRHRNEPYWRAYTSFKTYCLYIGTSVN